MLIKRRWVIYFIMIFWGVFLMSNFLIGEVLAAEYPTRPIQIIVPWSTGDTDLVARFLGSVLAKALGQPAVILNKPGSQGIIGMDFVFRARPDAYTLLVNGPAYLIVPKIQKTAFAVDDFIPLALISTLKGVVVVRKDAPWGNLTELIAYAKKYPGTLNFGSTGRGAYPNVKWEMIKNQTGIEVATIPYQGNAGVMMALLGGHIDIALSEIGSVVPYAKVGTLKILAISDKDKQFPGISTFAEQGISGDFNNWKGLFGRKDIPPERVKILEEACKKALNDPSYIEGLKTVESAPGSLVGDSFRKFIKEENIAVTKIVEKILTTKE